MDTNSDGRSRGKFDSSVSDRTYRCRIATRRYPIPFDTCDERREPKSIIWGKLRAVD